LAGGADSQSILFNPIPLKAGVRYPIRLEYAEKDLNASVRLFWSQDDHAREIIPPQYFFIDEGPESERGLQAEYTSLQDHMAYARKGDTLYAVTFEWPDGELALPIPEPAVGMKASLLGYNGTLPWRYAGGSLMVDLSGIPFGKIPGDWAWTVRLAGYLESEEEREGS
jgi:hypothetical protein